MQPATVLQFTLLAGLQVSYRLEVCTPSSVLLAPRRELRTLTDEIVKLLHLLCRGPQRTSIVREEPESRGIWMGPQDQAQERPQDSPGTQRDGNSAF